MMVLVIVFEPPCSWDRDGFERRLDKVTKAFGLQHVIEEFTEETEGPHDAFQICVTGLPPCYELTVDQATTIIHAVDVEKAKVLNFGYCLATEADVEIFAEVPGDQSQSIEKSN